MTNDSHTNIIDIKQSNIDRYVACSNFILYVFEKGKLLEFGNHQELMNANGQYAKTFRVQADRYDERRQNGRDNGWVFCSSFNLYNCTDLGGYSMDYARISDTRELYDAVANFLPDQEQREKVLLRNGTTCFAPFVSQRTRLYMEALRLLQRKRNTATYYFGS